MKETAVSIMDFVHVSQMEARLRVRYAETDQMGVVYHSNYLIWMEVGRVELCRANGVRYRDMEQDDGILLAVAEVRCRYLLPARYDDSIVVRTHFVNSHPRMVVFGYEILNEETGAAVATGETKHVFCQRDMKPARLPHKYHEQFGIVRG